MANDSRDRQLLHHEKPVWRKAFDEAMKRTSIEGATRNAWKAVDEWNRAGAFNETGSPGDATTANHVDPKSSNSTIYEEAWNVLIGWLSVAEGVDALTIEEPQKLVDLMTRFGNGTISYDAFKKQLNDLDSYV